MTKRINVTKTFLPPLNEYQKYLREIWANGQITNQGPILRRFEAASKGYLNVPHFQFVGNGTLAIQLAIKAFDFDPGEIITTPFSYVATTSAILWEGFTPVFADIDPETLCIDANKIEPLITPKTRAILGVHVFGNPCDVAAINTISKKYNLKVIYDAAHAFGVQYMGKSMLAYGDISTCSFHATKIFHTIEGGGIVTNDDWLNDRIELKKRFGHQGDEHTMLGINAKASEFQAAMGLVNYEHLADIIASRKRITEKYNTLLKGYVSRPSLIEDTRPNYSYYPVLFNSEAQLHIVLNALNEENIFPRRYFYPSLNELPYIKGGQECPISAQLSRRILCLPLYNSLKIKEVETICRILIKSLK